MLELSPARNWWDIQFSPDSVKVQINHFREESFTAKWLEANVVKPSASMKGKDGKEGPYSPEQLHQWFGDVNF
jgi:hypothetical protein